MRKQLRQPRAMWTRANPSARSTRLPPKTMQPTTIHNRKRPKIRKAWDHQITARNSAGRESQKDPQRPRGDPRRGRLSLPHLQDIHLEASRLCGAQLPLLKGQAGAPPDALVVQGLRDEESKRFRRTAHPETVRQAEALEVQVLEVVVAVGFVVVVVGGGVTSNRKCNNVSTACSGGAFGAETTQENDACAQRSVGNKPTDETSTYIELRVTRTNPHKLGRSAV